MIYFQKLLQYLTNERCNYQLSTVYFIHESIYHVSIAQYPNNLSPKIFYLKNASVFLRFKIHKYYMIILPYSLFSVQSRISTPEVQYQICPPRAFKTCQTNVENGCFIGWKLKNQKAKYSDKSLYVKYELKIVEILLEAIFKF